MSPRMEQVQTVDHTCVTVAEINACINHIDGTDATRSVYESNFVDTKKEQAKSMEFTVGTA